MFFILIKLIPQPAAVMERRKWEHDNAVFYWLLQSFHKKVPSSGFNPSEGTDFLGFICVLCSLDSRRAKSDAPRL